MSRRPRDYQTPDMFMIPTQRPPVAGAYDFDQELRHKLSEVLKRSTLSRYEVAARMSELVGRDISKNQLDAWTAESRPGWRFPLEYLPALESACETHDVMRWLADIRGCKLVIGEEALIVELTRLEREEGELKRRKQHLKRYLGHEK